MPPNTLVLELHTIFAGPSEQLAPALEAWQGSRHAGLACRDCSSAWSCFETLRTAMDALDVVQLWFEAVESLYRG